MCIRDSFGSDPELRQIIGVTLQMSVTSTLISVGLGIPLGTLIGMYQFRGKGILMRIINTLMGLPPVVAGLLVFFLDVYKRQLQARSL